MSKQLKIIILIILLAGIIYRLVMTANGNFLFNMDNARDMVDVREMVVLHKWRLTGPTSAIEGLFNGPAWYYLLAVPFIASGGDPYASILMEIVLWAIGGFFLLKLVNRWGSWLVLPIGVIWIASDYIVLTNAYAFNPNPCTLLAPVFLYLLVEYLKNKKLVIGILTWFLAGLFFNFEMNFGIFTPLIIFVSLIATKNMKLLKQKEFWIGVAFFVLTLIPQLVFDLKHQFIMSKALLAHLSGNAGTVFNLQSRFQTITESFFNSFVPTLMNQKLFSWLILGLSLLTIYGYFKEKKKEDLVLVSLIFIFVPFVSYLFLPVTVNSWHLGGEMAVSLILVAYLLKQLMEGGFYSKLLSLYLTASIIVFGITNTSNLIRDYGKPNLDPSLYKNEISAIDYVYKYAKGENFKVYVFMPSIYDYPYQYLFWWYGQKKYGYIPAEYAYAPGKTLYISNKDKFAGSTKNYNGLVFLIKEPNRGYNWKSGWEADYRFMEFLSGITLGLVDIEVRRDVSK